MQFKIKRLVQRLVQLWMFTEDRRQDTRAIILSMPTLFLFKDFH